MTLRWERYFSLIREAIPQFRSHRMRRDLKSPEKHLEAICNSLEAVEELVSLQHLIIKLFMWDYGRSRILLLGKLRLNAQRFDYELYTARPQAFNE